MRLLDDGCGADGCGEQHFYTFTDTPALCGGSKKQASCLWPVHGNFVSADLWAPSHSWPVVAGFLAPKVSPAGVFDQHEIFHITAAGDRTDDDPTGSGAGKVAMVVAQLPLATTPSAAGKAVHFTVMARSAAPGSTISLMIDRGDKKWIQGHAAVGGDQSNTDFQIRSFQAELGFSGEARMAILLSGDGTLAAEVGWVSVAAIGAPFKSDDDDIAKTLSRM